MNTSLSQQSKTCRRCHTEKPLTEFGLKGKTLLDGQPAYNSKCKKCLCALQTIYYNKRKSAGLHPRYGKNAEGRVKKQMPSDDFLAVLEDIPKRGGIKSWTLSEAKALVEFVRTWRAGDMEKPLLDALKDFSRVGGKASPPACMQILNELRKAHREGFTIEVYWPKRQYKAGNGVLYDGKEKASE